MGVRASERRGAGEPWLAGAVSFSATECFTATVARERAPGEGRPAGCLPAVLPYLWSCVLISFRAEGADLMGFIPVLPAAPGGVLGTTQQSPRMTLPSVSVGPRESGNGDAFPRGRSSGGVCAPPPLRVPRAPRALGSGRLACAVPPPAPRPREGDELLLPVSCRRRTQAPRGRASVPASRGPKAGQLPRRLRPAPRGTGVAGAGRKHSLVSQVPVEWRLAPGGVPGTRGTVWGPWCGTFPPVWEEHREDAISGEPERDRGGGRG